MIRCRASQGQEAGWGQKRPGSGGYQAAKQASKCHQPRQSQRHTCSIRDKQALFTTTLFILHAHHTQPALACFDLPILPSFVVLPTRTHYAAAPHKPPHRRPQLASQQQTSDARPLNALALPGRQCFVSPCVFPAAAAPHPCPLALRVATHVRSAPEPPPTASPSLQCHAAPEHVNVCRLHPIGPEAAGGDLQHPHAQLCHPPGLAGAY